MFFNPDVYITSNEPTGTRLDIPGLKWSRFGAIRRIDETLADDIGLLTYAIHNIGEAADIRKTSVWRYAEKGVIPNPVWSAIVPNQYSRTMVYTYPEAVILIEFLRWMIATYPTKVWSIRAMSPRFAKAREDMLTSISAVRDNFREGLGL